MIQSDYSTNSWEKELPIYHTHYPQSGIGGGGSITQIPWISYLTSTVFKDELLWMPQWKAGVNGVKMAGFLTMFQFEVFSTPNLDLLNCLRSVIIYTN